MEYCAREYSSVASTKFEIKTKPIKHHTDFWSRTLLIIWLYYSFKGTMEAVAKHDFNANEVDELSFRKSQILKVTRIYFVFHSVHLSYRIFIVLYLQYFFFIINASCDSQPRSRTHSLHVCTL